jgi:hypothetical protein
MAGAVLAVFFPAAHDPLNLRAATPAMSERHTERAHRPSSANSVDTFPTDRSRSR